MYYYIRTVAAVSGAFMLNFFVCLLNIVCIKFKTTFKKWKNENYIDIFPILAIGNILNIFWEKYIYSCSVLIAVNLVYNSFSSLYHIFRGQ